MWSGRPSSTTTSPPAIPAATRKVATTRRSGMTRWVAGWSSSTPVTSIREVPAPVILAPMAVRNSARSCTSGSRAAFSMTVVPLASTAAIRTLSVPVWLGYSRTTRVPTSRGTEATVDSTRASTYPWADSNDAPRDSRARRCMSMGRGPKSSPPGSETRAQPQRVSRGPRTTTEARIFSTSS